MPLIDWTLVNQYSFYFIPLYLVSLIALFHIVDVDDPPFQDWVIAVLPFAAILLYSDINPVDMFVGFVLFSFRVTVALVLVIEVAERTFVPDHRGPLWLPPALAAGGFGFVLVRHGFIAAIGEVIAVASLAYRAVVFGQLTIPGITVMDVLYAAIIVLAVLFLPSLWILPTVTDTEAEPASGTTRRGHSADD